MKVKKYLSLLLAVVMIASVFSTTAFASESELPVNEVIIGGDSLEYRAPNPPTLFYNLGGSGQYTATLIDLAANRGSYTKYYFATSTGEIYLKFDLERSGTTTNKNRELIIYVYEKKTASDTGTLVTAATINFTTAEYTTQLTYDGQDTGMCILWRFGQSPSTIIRCRLVRYSVFSAIVRLIFSWSPLEHPLLYYRASK